MVITVTIAIFDVSRVLIDVGSSCDIMYVGLFEKMGLEREKLLSCEGSDLQAFNDTLTYPCRYVEMVVTLGEKHNIRTIDAHFLVVPCHNIYNVILDRLFTKTLYAMVSPVHLKMNYHNIHDEPITINADLTGVKRIYQALQQEKKEGKVVDMQINMALLSKLIKYMGIHSPIKKMSQGRANKEKWMTRRKF